MENKNVHLGEAPIGKLMKGYAIPCIISLLVGALYNIVDQIFIANASYLGSYGNAANTVVFPLTVVALAIAVMVGDGCCAFVSMALGQEEPAQAKRCVGNAVVLTVAASLVLTAVYLLFADGIIAIFGGTVNEETFRHSQEYFFYITLGVPFYMFGKAFNREDRAQEILDYYDTLAKKAEDLVKDIPENEKKTAIFLGQYVGSTAPDTTLQGMAIEQAGGINPAADFGRGELWAQGGMERVMQWNPDFIFMANDLTSRDYTLESTISDPANAALKAVQDGHVYESPCSLDLWMYPSLSIRLGVLWMINRMYPERLSDDELAQTAQEFYKTIYGLDVTREQLGF